MIVTILFEENDLFNIEIPDNEQVDELKSIIMAEVKTVETIELVHKGTLLSQGNVLDYGITSGDIIAVRRAAVNPSASTSQPRVQISNLGELPFDITPEAFISICRDNPELLNEISIANTQLATNLRNGNIPEIRKYLMSRYLAHHKSQYDQQVELNRIAANPDSEENQRKIAEKIMEQNIRENMELALENIPESFSQVNMLYINCEINDIQIRAFVDSGAQSTIMSKSCVERCGLSRLVDTRYSGEARGVGTGKILGRIHIAQIKLGQSFFPVSITVLDSVDVDFLFGLDMLKRHRCCIDLASNSLRIEGFSKVEEIPFI